MATIYAFSPDIFADGQLDQVGAIQGDFFAQATGGFTTAIASPSFRGRSGPKAIYLSNVTSSIRAVLRAGSRAEVIFHCAFYLGSLPDQTGGLYVDFRDNNNISLARCDFTTVGALNVVNASGVATATSIPAITPGNWTVLEIRVRTGAGTGVMEIRDANGNVLVNAASQAFTSNSISQFAIGLNRNFEVWLSDLFVKDTLGSSNNSFGPRGVYAQSLVGDAAGNGWAIQARRRIGAGVVRSNPVLGTNDRMTVADAVSLELGSGAYTIEGNFRFSALPGTGNDWALLSKWDEASNGRSWRLRLTELTGNYRLAFEVSTGGTAATITVLHDVAFTPVLNRWYHIAVNRTGTTTNLYVDGVRVAPSVTDSRVYFDSNAPIAGFSSFPDFFGNSSVTFNGFADEIRLTVGAGRYPAEFAVPSAPFPRSASDPLWNNTQLLIGFDNGTIVDESQFNRVVSTGVFNTVTAEITNDGLFGYQSLDRPSRDDTFIEAAFLPASGTFELVSQPLNNTTFTLGRLPSGSVVYTFVTAVPSAANQVRIGVDVDTTLANLRAAINLEAGAGTLYGTGTVAHPDVFASDVAGSIARLTARVPGAAGNAVTLATNVAGAVLSGATLAGGVNIPAPSEFTIGSLPSGVTAVSSVIIATRRQAIGGVANIQASIRDAFGNLINGADLVAPATPAWNIDILDQGAGGSAWSTASLIGARVRDNRTV